MLYVLIEKKYKEFPWCARTLDSISEEIRKKRLTIREIREIAEIPQSDPEPMVMLVGGTEQWFANLVHYTSARNIVPIALINRSITPWDGMRYSVGMDVCTSIRIAVDYLHSLGKYRLAMFGVNPQSCADPERASHFAYLTGRQAHIYRMNTSYEDMFRCFSQHMQEYDGVVCVNDYAAFYLVHQLVHLGIDPTKDIYIIGQGNMSLAKMSKPSITSVSDDYEHYGRSAVAIYNMLLKEPYMSTIHIQLGSHLHIRETTGGSPYVPAAGENTAVEDEQPNLFFQDRDVAAMAGLESMLSQCDETDFLIIRCLVNDEPYSEIARQCFVSETTAKYRIKKMESLCGVSSRAELCTYLRWIT